VVGRTRRLPLHYNVVNRHLLLLFLLMSKQLLLLLLLLLLLPLLLLSCAFALQLCAGRFR
jgi:hypothetical protein